MKTDKRTQLIITSSLCLLFLALSLFFRSSFFHSRYLNDKMDRFQQSIYKSEDNFSSIADTIASKSNQLKLEFNDIIKYNNKDFAVLYYIDQELIYWSNRSFVPENYTSRLTGDNQVLIPFTNEYYYILSHEITPQEVVVYLKPLLENKQTRYNSLFHDKALFTIDTDKDKKDVVNNQLYNSENQWLGMLQSTNGQYSTTYLEVSWILFCVFLIISSIQVVHGFIERKNPNRTIVLAVAFYLIKLIIKHDPLGAFAEFEWANPSLYANQYIGSSFLVLVVNLIFLAILMFDWYAIPIQFKLFGKELSKPVSAVILGLTFSFVFVFLAYSVRSLLLDSGEVIFFEPTTSSYIAIVTMLMFSLFLFYIMLSTRLMRYIRLHFSQNLEYVTFFVFGLVSFICLVLIFPLTETLVQLIWVLLLLSTVSILISNKNHTIGQMSGFALLILISSIYAAVAIQNYSKVKLKNHLTLLGRQILQKNDDLAEFLLNNVKDEVESDPVINKMVDSPLVSDNTIFQRIKSLYLENDFTDYTINFSLNRYDSILIPEAKLIQEPSYDQFKYRLLLPLNTDEEQVVVEVDLHQPKIIVHSNFYTNYLGKRTQDFVENQDFSYAINENGEYKFVKGNMKVPPKLPNIEELEVDKSILESNDSGYNFYYRNSDSEVVEIHLLENSRSNNIWLNITSYFTFFFLGFLIVIILATRFKLRNAKFFRESLGNQIQFVILGMMFLVGFIIAFISLESIYNEINKLTRVKWENHNNQIVDEYYSRLDENELTETSYSFEKYLQLLYSDAKMDIQYFNENGDLLYANNNRLYQDRVWPKKVNPLALSLFTNTGTVSFQDDERVEKQKFVGFYRALRDSDWNLQGILYLPGFDIENEINAERNVVVVTEYQSFAIVLFLFTIVSLFLTQSFISLLNSIRERIAQVDLNQKVEPIEWNANDEIGLLVKEYNEMVKKLDESAILLARSERESAWKEVAKQVAHEIKNPLTPMKLSIQHLRRRLLAEENNGSSDYILRTLETIEMQTEHLAVIATNFSSIAKMDLPDLETVDLIKLVEDTALMFSENDNYDFELHNELSSNNALVHADDTMINRVLTNLLKNATQALDSSRQGLISVTLSEELDNYIIEVSDNGKGIALKDRAKIFTPNFTTKSSGSGLGLMISKRIIEMHKGKLYFESVSHQGTSFFIVLPKMMKS